MALQRQEYVACFDAIAQAQGGWRRAVDEGSALLSAWGTTRARLVALQQPALDLGVLGPIARSFELLRRAIMFSQR